MSELAIPVGITRDGNSSGSLEDFEVVIDGRSPPVVRALFGDTGSHRTNATGSQGKVMSPGAEMEDGGRECECE